VAVVAHSRAAGAADAAAGTHVSRLAVPVASSLRQALLPLPAGRVARRLGGDAQREWTGAALLRTGGGAGRRAAPDRRLSGLATCAGGAGKTDGGIAVPTGCTGGTAVIPVADIGWQGGI